MHSGCQDSSRDRGQHSVVCIKDRGDLYRLYAAESCGYLVSAAHIDAAAEVGRVKDDPINDDQYCKNEERKRNDTENGGRSDDPDTLRHDSHVFVMRDDRYEALINGHKAKRGNKVHESELVYEECVYQSAEDAEYDGQYERKTPWHAGVDHQCQHKA